MLCVLAAVPAGLQLIPRLPAPGGGLPIRTWPGTIQVSRSRVNASGIVNVIIVTNLFCIPVTE